MVERDELTFVEEMGALFERLGYGRMAGRVWGYLLVVDAEQVSAADLVEALDSSPSAISTATRVLISLGLVDR
ncbi:MAG: MarR family transcriptional regulator, partial [Acidimicrobiia bacterium]|nr:MarR family transcriptional regulator [Acidimicrobiia bacterium]